MYIKIANENYGYAVATGNDYVVVSNPCSFRNSSSSANSYTGSSDYYRYNKNTDSHDLIGTLYLSSSIINLLLSAESSSNLSLRDPLHVENNNGGFSFGKDIAADDNLYTSSYEDGFGKSLDMYESLLIVGSPYVTKAINTKAISFVDTWSTVNIFNLDNELNNQPPFICEIQNPDISVSQSFGTSVSINNDWIAIGSPYVSSSMGMVYLFNQSGSGWNLYQKLQVSSTTSNLQFGWSLKLNKDDANSGSLIVGCANPNANVAYYFEFISGSWQNTFNFKPTTTQYPLTFGNYTPYSSSTNISGSGYGYSVSTYGDTVVVGEYLDRLVYEFSGSTPYNQGSVSIYQRCSSPQTLFSLALKSYGTSSILKNNCLGYSVDIYNGYVVAGSPKINNKSMSSLYVASSIGQLNYCNPDEETLTEDNIAGQSFLLEYDSVNGWQPINIYQRKKRFLGPYRCYGNSVAIGERSMVIGAPMLLSDMSRSLNLEMTQSGNYSIDNICGQSYIYNIANLSETFHIGNVFYRNGKVILSTSGLVYDNIFSTPHSAEPYLYDMTFQGRTTLYEKQIVCSVEPGEFNVSTNPTSLVITTSSFDINNNGVFDFQDMDVILRYIQYKNTSTLGINISTNWSSSAVTTNDEQSLLAFYQSQYLESYTSTLASASIQLWETTETWVQDQLDFNQDGRLDTRDINIMWKYFSNRLNQRNYNTYITPSSQRKYFNQAIDYLNSLTQLNSIPTINGNFLDYDRLSYSDKTGSYLAPYVTAVGLYDGLDLVAIAKLGSPIKLIPDLPFNFVVKMDY